MTKLLEFRGIGKSFKGVAVLDGISFALEQGKIHAILGENGAGKSTLVNILCGLLQADSGEVIWQGEQVCFKTLSESKKSGIGVVFQHFSLIDKLTVLENIVLGNDYQGSWQVLQDEIVRISREYQLQIDPNKFVYNLSAGEKQRVEIVRCLLQKPQLIVLDEPTSVLTPDEVNGLFETLRQCRKNNCSILFIGHKLGEVKQICDTYTILRQGKLVESNNIASYSVEQIAEKMVGEKIAVLKKNKVKNNNEKSPVIELNYQTNDGRVNFKFSAFSGKILGIAGISGNGQDKLLSILCGESLIEKNSLLFNNEGIGNWSIEKRNKNGIFYVPTERIGHSVVGEMHLQDNALVNNSNNEDLVRNDFVRQGKLQEWCRKIVDKFHVKPADTKQLARYFSGGNLQKFVMGRAMLGNPKVLVVANPTWGVDIKSSIYIRQQLIRLSELGACVIISSEDLNEILSICDEVQVICKKQLSEVKPVEQWTMAQLSQKMTAIDWL